VLLQVTRLIDNLVFNIMKKLKFIIILLFLMPLYSVAQETNTNTHDLGLNLSGPHTFGIRYRTGSENTLLRLTLLSLDGSNQTSKAGVNSSKFGSSGVGFNIGFEKRKLIADNLSFYIGADLLTTYTSNTSQYDNLSQKTKTWNMSAGPGIVLGFVFNINSNINISAEVLPSFVYSYGKTTINSGGVETSQNNSGFSYGLSDTGANLTLSFRLGKKH
jgi:hypothetical protein